MFHVEGTALVRWQRLILYLHVLMGNRQRRWEPWLLWVVNVDAMRCTESIERRSLLYIWQTLNRYRQSLRSLQRTPRLRRRREGRLLLQEIRRRLLLERLMECLLLRKRVGDSLLWKWWWNSLMDRLNRLIRTMLSFRRSWRSGSWLGLLLGRRRFQVATLMMIVRRYFIGAEGDANTARTRMVHFTVGSNDSSQCRRRF